MYFDASWAIPHIASLLIATGFLLAAVFKPPLARKLYTALFAYAALVNAAVALFKPASYLGNARYALLEAYRAFILGWFSQHITLAVGTIALGQALISIGLSQGDRRARVALVGAIAFFLAIAPLGVASAFPSSLIWAAGAARLMYAQRGRALAGTLNFRAPVPPQGQARPS